MLWYVFCVGLSRFASIICHSPKAQMNYMFVVSDLKSNSTYEDIRTKTTEKAVETWLKLILLCLCITKRSGTFPLLWLLYTHFRDFFKSWSLCLCEYRFGMWKPTTRDPLIVSRIRCDFPGSPISLRSISKLPWMRCTPCCWGTFAWKPRIPQGSKNNVLFMEHKKRHLMMPVLRTLKLVDQWKANEDESKTLANFWQRRIKVWYIKY